MIYVLLEHQSSEDRWMGHPQARRLPAVIPLVLHHGKQRWRAATRMEQVLNVDGALEVVAR